MSCHMLGKYPDAFGMSSGCDKFLDMTEEDMSKHLG